MGHLLLLPRHRVSQLSNSYIVFGVRRPEHILHIAHCLVPYLRAASHDLRLVVVYNVLDLFVEQVVEVLINHPACFKDKLLHLPALDGLRKSLFNMRGKFCAEHIPCVRADDVVNFRQY